jgi:hypothetical protein
MKFIAFAAATFVMGGAVLVGQDAAYAKGPLEITVDPRLILVKETPTELETSDFPFGLEEGKFENVRMTFDHEMLIPEEDDSLSMIYTITLPTLEVEKDGDDKVTIIFPEEYSVSMSTSAEGDELQIDMEGTADDPVMTFERDGDRMKYSGSASAFAITLTSPQAAEEGVDFSFTMGSKGLDIEGAGAAEQDWTDMQSLDISYAYTADEITYAASVSGEEDGQEFAMTGAASAIAASGMIGEGRIEGLTDAKDMTISISKPLPIEAEIGRLRSEIVMPTKPSPKPQDMKYLISAEEIVLDDFLWAMMDRNNAFKRELNKIVIDLEMQAMMMVNMLDADAIAEAELSGLPPMIPTGVKINSIFLDGLGLKVDATGEGALKGTQPQGNAYVTVKGLSDFVAGARKAGMFGDQEAMIIEGMAGQLGKEGDDGELIFDIETDGAMININGAPVMPIPSME